MKASIYDNTALNALGIGELNGYLHASGWQVERQFGDRGVIWIKRFDNKEFEILVPQQRAFTDYAIHISQGLEVLSAVEERSELEIYRDIVQTQMDTVRLQFRSSVFEDGSVPLKQAVKIVEQARDMMLAAACATVEAKPYYHKRKQDKAMEHLDKVRMGQTEHGSFVLTLQTSVPPRLRREAQEPPLFPELASSPEEPFERRVTLTLANSVLEAGKATLLAETTGDFSPFQQAVSKGVNANLCAAIAEMGLETNTNTLSIGFHWSPSRALLEQIPSQVEFTKSHFQTLREAAQIFRSNAPMDDFELQGFVVRLGREEGNLEGQVTISGTVDNTLRRIQVTLNDIDYQVALDAHRHRQPVQCVGELVQEGRSWALRNPRNFAILN